MSRDSNDRENRRGVSPAHWQGQPVPDKTAQPTRNVGIDKRGAGTARQYGRAGDLGKKNNDQEERPPRGATLPDAEVLDHVKAELQLSGVDVRGVMVAVHAGEVVLDGEVPTQDDKLTLEQRLAHCRGVVTVRNQLTIAA